MAAAICLAITLLARGALAEMVAQTMPGELAALAEFRVGKTDKPAILLLHGFLQTHQFPTIFRLTEALNGEGYSVLAPTLTLGVPNRRQSLACEAIHTHTLKQDDAEIDAWVGWLVAKGHRDIVLIGHSTGSLNLLHYLTNQGHPAARKLIGISLVEARLDLDVKKRRNLVADLRRRIAHGDTGLVEHPLSYCKRYVASPAGLLSYLDWTPDRILSGIEKLALPQAYIMGDHDDRLGRNWIPRLKKTGRQVHVIEGANHFMDGEHEFDLLDEVVKELRRPPIR